MSTTPIELNRLKNRRLKIVWSDGKAHEISYHTLRDHCPCASCRTPDDEPESKNPLQVLSAAETIPLDIVSMSPVGNYAYNVNFTDGHTTGIFTFDLLYRLGESETNTD